MGKESSSSSSAASSGGIGFGEVLTILFIGLKLTHYINWSWVWVLSPMWIGLAIFILIVLGALIFAGIAAVFGR